MCFSATASFASSAVLTTVGLATLYKTTRPPQYAFAAIPFIFAIQQFSEGWVWVSLNNATSATWEAAPMYAFMVFAFVVWPIAIPLSIFMLEDQTKKKKIMYISLALGLLLSIYYGYSIADYGVTAIVEGHHIDYKFSRPHTINPLTVIVYALVTVVPLFLSSAKKMWLLGVLLGVAYIVSYIFYHGYETSVWCYFASLISLVIYWILYQNNKQESPNYNRLAIS